MSRCCSGVGRKGGRRRACDQPAPPTQDTSLPLSQIDKQIMPVNTDALAPVYIVYQQSEDDNSVHPKV